MTDFSELQSSFQFERQKKIADPIDELSEPLREAEFEKIITGTYYAEFSRESIVELKNITKGKVRQFMEALLKDKYTSTAIPDVVCINEASVSYILSEIDHYKEGGTWDD